MADSGQIHDVHCAVFVALKEEFDPLARRLEGCRSYRRESLRYTVGFLAAKPIAICRTGIGRQNAVRKSRALLGHVRPRAILVTGFAGGLAPGWTAGDCLVASRITDVPARETENLVAAELPSWDAPEDLVERALSLPHEHNVRAGHLVSVERVLRTAGQKAAVGTALEAQAVDMESSGVLSVSAPEGIPTLCVRVILDDQDFELPLDFGKIMTPEGELDRLKTLIAVGSRPHKWSRLANLRKRAIAATEVLEAAVPRILDAL